MSRSKLIVLVVGVAGGFGINEIRHAIAQPTVVIVQAPVSKDVLTAAEHAAQERGRWTRLILDRLENEPLSNKEKVKRVRSLGLLRSHEAIPYLLKNLHLEDEESQGTVSALTPIEHLYPCYGALQAMEDAAVPSLVEAYTTGSLNVWQIRDLQGRLGENKRLARTAYIYAQGYIAATKHDPIRREAALHLIRTLGEKVASDDLPFPPRWMGADEVIKSAP